MTGPAKGGLGELQVSIVAGGAGTYYKCALLKSIGFKHSGSPVDITVLGDEYTAVDKTLNSVIYSGNGFFDYYGDTTGQKALWDCLANGAETWVHLLYDGTHYVKSEIKVTGFTISTKPQGMVDTAITLDSTGTISWG